MRIYNLRLFRWVRFICLLLALLFPHPAKADYEDVKQNIVFACRLFFSALNPGSKTYEPLPIESYGFRPSFSYEEPKFNPFRFYDPPVRVGDITAAKYDEVRRKIQSKLGFMPEIRWVKHLKSSGSYRRIVLYHPESKKEIAFLDYGIQDGDVSMGDMMVVPNYRQSGLGMLLFAEMLDRSGPVKSIFSNLDKDNRYFLMKYSTGDDCEPGLLRTPAFLIRAYFGFTNVTLLDCYDSYFKVSKP